MSWLVSPGSDLTVVAAKTVLMYTTALVGLRLAERRALAQWTIIDFAAAVWAHRPRLVRRAAPAGGVRPRSGALRAV